jgi:hypothetical protein
MPEVRHYVVEQIREVKVTANSLEDAVRIATAAFKVGQNSDAGVGSSGLLPELKGVWGNTTSRIRERSVHAKEER